MIGAGALGSGQWASERCLGDNLSRVIMRIEVTDECALGILFCSAALSSLCNVNFGSKADQQSSVESKRKSRFWFMRSGKIWGISWRNQLHIVHSLHIHIPGTAAFVILAAENGARSRSGKLGKNSAWKNVRLIGKKKKTVEKISQSVAINTRGPQRHRHT